MEDVYLDISDPCEVDELIEYVRGVVRAIVRALPLPSGKEEDDIVQEVLVKIFKNRLYEKYTKDVLLKCLWPTVRNHIIDQNRRGGEGGAAVSLDAPRKGPDGDGWALIDLLPAPDRLDSPGLVDLIESLEEFLDREFPQNKSVLYRMVDLYQWTIQEAAAQFGIPMGSAGGLLKEVREAVRAWLRGQGY